MTALQIILLALGALLLLLLVLLLFGRLRVRLDYRGELSVCFQIFGAKFVPKPSKKGASGTELFDLTDADHPEKIIQKRRALQKKQAQKAEEKEEKAKRKRAKKQAKKEKQSFSLKELSFAEILPFVLDLLKEAYRITKGKFRLRIHRLQIVVGSPDPATTALLYGSISAALAGILDFLDANWIPTKVDAGGISVKPDFLASSPSGEVSLTASVGLCRGLTIFIKGLSAYQTKLRAAQKKKNSTPSEDQPLSEANDTITTQQKG